MSARFSDAELLWWIAIQVRRKAMAIRDAQEAAMTRRRADELTRQAVQMRLAAIVERRHTRDDP